MARPYPQNLRDRGGCGGGERSHLSRCGGAVWGECCQRGEMVAAVSSDRPAAVKMGGGRPLRLKSERDWLLARIAEKPDLTLRAVVAELAERGTPASYGAVWRFFAHERITFKKSLHASEQDRVDIARRRARWKMHQGRFDPRRLVFLDETWARQHDAAPRALRARRPAGRQGAARPLAHIRTKTHDYVRHGTLTLFAALNYLEGKLITQLATRHRHQEWLAFLKTIDDDTPADLDIHVIADNDATRKHPAVTRWLDRHARFHMYDTPTSSSWMNLVERFFRDLTAFITEKGFASTLELAEAIAGFLAPRNQNPRRYL